MQQRLRLRLRHLWTRSPRRGNLSSGIRKNVHSRGKKGRKKSKNKKREGEKYKSELHGNENELGRRQRRAAAQLQRFICLRLGHNPSHKVRCVWQQQTPLYLYTSPSLAWHMFDAPSAAFLNISNFSKNKNKLRIDSSQLGVRK